MADIELTEVVINTCYGGFSLSKPCIQKIHEIFTEHGQTVSVKAIRDGFNYGCGDVIDTSKFQDKRLTYRSHPFLLQAVKELGEDDASGSCAQLRIVKVPTVAMASAKIGDYDGGEWVDWSVASPLVNLIDACDVDSLSLDDAKSLLLQLKNIASAHHYRYHYR
jgi:hypothetical protein